VIFISKKASKYHFLTRTNDYENSPSNIC